MIEMNNSTKSNKSDNKKQTKPQQDKQNGSVNTEKKEQTNEKSNQQEQPKEETQTKSNGVCIVDYIGNGVWIDSENQKWANKDVSGTNIKCQRKYSADEYDKRDDIKFMVSYGEMKLTTVE